MNFLKKGTIYRSNLDRRSPLKMTLGKKKQFERKKGSFQFLDKEKSSDLKTKYSSNNSKLNFIIKKSRERILKGQKEDQKAKHKNIKMRILPRKDLLKDKKMIK